MSLYSAALNGSPCHITIDRGGISCGNTEIGYAEVINISAVNHRVFIDTQDGRQEISMLGFSFDGFWEELVLSFGNRALESLFAGETAQMTCEGEYHYLGEGGRAKIKLFSDSVCILPLTAKARRIPLCFAADIQIDGYLMTVSLNTGETFSFGRMGFDTKPFFERVVSNCKKIRKEREKRLMRLSAESPFTHCGLFRTEMPEHWQAAFGENCCAVEFKTEENAATYLYRFNGPKADFLQNLKIAMEAVGMNREIILIPEEKLNKNPLYRMSLIRAPSVNFLRSSSAGRLIHNQSWEKNLSEFLNG